MFNFKFKFVLFSLTSLSFKPLKKESVSFFPHKWKFYTNVVPQQETIQYSMKEPFIKLKRINAFLSAKAPHVSQLKQFMKRPGFFLFKMQVESNYPT